MLLLGETRLDVTGDVLRHALCDIGVAVLVGPRGRSLFIMLLLILMLGRRTPEILWVSRRMRHITIGVVHVSPARY